ncbi:DUF192 domain-containing protein [Dehalococcoidia bacterium]|nr:DUF192 domain-containing protein [Dehalococcoidia bacterium]
MSGTAIVTIGPKQWEVYLATTYEEIIQGLGEVISIPPQTGMLFDLGYDQVITVTTVPMLFPLDIVFISSDLRVVDIARNVPPGNLVASDEFARYFLEVNAGETAGVQIGDEVHVHVLVYPAEIRIPPPPPPPMDDIVNFGMTTMAMLFAGNIAVSVIESAFAPPEKEKELPLGRKLLPPRKLLLLPRTKGSRERDPWFGKQAVEIQDITGEELKAIIKSGEHPLGLYIGPRYFIPTIEPGRIVGYLQVVLGIPRRRLRVHDTMPRLPDPTPGKTKLEQLQGGALKLYRTIIDRWPEGPPDPWPEEFEQIMDRLAKLADEIIAERKRRGLPLIPLTRNPSNKELTGKWFDRGVEAGKTDGWMTLEDTVGETLEDHPKIRDAAELVWTDIELWEETVHFQILYGSEMLEDAGGDIDLYSDLKAEFWEGYLTGRKEIGFDIYKIAAELIRQRERGLEKPEDPLPKVEGKHLPKTADKRRRTGNIGKKLRPTRDDVAVRAWSERDRLGIWIVDNRTDETIAEWWDEAAREMFEAGFFKPGVPQHSWEEPSREFVDSVLDYAEDMGWLAKDNPFKFSPRTAAGGRKIRARSITLRRLEGDRQRDDFSSHTLTPLDDKSVWERANSLLRKWSETAPRRGEGYHKVSFIVTYEDGETYQGRFDLKHYTVEYPDLAKHIYHFVAFYAGRYCPPHMTEEQYKEFLEDRIVVEIRTDFINFLDNYEIGNGSPKGNPGEVSPRLIGRIRRPETPERLEFFADSRDHIEDSIKGNGLHPQLEAVFLESIARAKGEKIAKKIMGD